MDSLGFRLGDRVQSAPWLQEGEELWGTVVDVFSKVKVGVWFDGEDTYRFVSPDKLIRPVPDCGWRPPVSTPSKSESWHLPVSEEAAQALDKVFSEHEGSLRITKENLDRAFADLWGGVTTDFSEEEDLPGSYYDLPGGVSAWDVSRHLTSNTGQAVQYLIRSSRLDGVYKSDTVEGRVEDLEKALDFVVDEIMRLEGELAG